MTKVALDSNVWLSAALSPFGAPAQVVRYVLLSGTPVFSEATFNEFETMLWRPKFDRYISLEVRRALLRDIKGAAQWNTIPPALAANAPYLISGDRDLLAVESMADLQIVSTAEALTMMM